MDGHENGIMRNEKGEKSDAGQKQFSGSVASKGASSSADATSIYSKTYTVGSDPLKLRRDQW